MNVEDSYEGAVRRLRRLGHAGIDRVPPPPVVDERTRDLEDLATLACEENERLTRELEGARNELDRLRRLVTTLQETLAGDEESFAPPKSGRGAAFYFFTLLFLGGGGLALFVYRPWEQLLRRSVAVAASAPAVQPAAPVVVAPPPVAVAPPPVAVAPKVEPVVPKVVEPIVPKVVEPVVPKVAPVQRHHSSKHHSAKSSHREHKHGAAARSGDQPEAARTNDPLGGLNL